MVNNREDDNNNSREAEESDNELPEEVTEVEVAAAMPQLPPAPAADLQ